eukprot:scaffold2572_cov75-Skeletonema_marinoi.AAC.28
MANYYGSLEAVDCHIHSVRFNMAVLDGFIRSPMTLQRRRYADEELEQWNMSSAEIGSLKSIKNVAPSKYAGSTSDSSN